MKYLIFILMLTPLFGNNEKNSESFSSIAYDQEKGIKIYRENHSRYYSDSGIDKWITEYRDMENNLIAKRDLTFGDDPTKPDFFLEDKRTGYLEGAKSVGENKLFVFTRESKDVELRSDTLEVEAPFVVDGGLTFFFRENWDRLLNDEIVEFNFVAPAKLDTYEFRLTKNRIFEKSGRKFMEIFLEIDNFFLRQFVDPIVISYDLESKAIYNYKGVSNINNDDGKSYDVEIDYSLNFEKAEQ